MKSRKATPAPGQYLKRKERTNRRQEQQSRSARDIGAIRDIADPERREACRQDPERFLKVYNPEAFALPFCQDHFDAIDRIEEAFSVGALFAFAMDRGKGKTTLCRMMGLRAMSYAKLRYLFLLGANAEKGRDNLAAIRTYMRFLPLFRADFPEISQAVEHLAGIAQKAGGQLSDGLPTQIEWGQDRIFLPTVKPPRNWRGDWPLRSDGMAPTSGAVVGAAGLTAEGIRGCAITLSTGETLRPDGVLLDDPQSAESAASATQNVTRLQLISADVLGMAGPGKTIAAVMPCTVIAPGDMVDQVLDRKKNPVWRGERRGILKSMPKNLPAWENYFQVYFECAQKEPPDYEAANAVYCSHRAELDEGAEASWPERKLPREISAVQHAMHLYARDKFAFWSEYMNRPLVKEVAGEQLDKDRIAARVNQLAEFVVPLNASIITVGIDVGQSILWYCACAWEPSTFTGNVLTYGAWPRQDRAYFTNTDARRTLAHEFPGAEVEAAVQGGLEKLAAQLLGREWINEAGSPMKVSLALVDSKWKPDAIQEWCRRTPHAASLLASQGRYVGAKAVKQWHQYEKRPGERLGLHWLIGPVATSKRATRVAAIDVNYWKTTIAQKLSIPAGNSGAIRLFGRSGDDHRMFADHCTAQYFVDVSANGRTVREWLVRPDRKDMDHLWDCLNYATAAASIQGAVLQGVHEAPKPAATGNHLAEAERKRREFLARRGF